MVSRSSLLVALAALTAFTGCATAPEPFEIGDTLEVKATVTQLDVATRLMTLRGPAGNEFTFEVDPAVRNLPQVKVGDDVVVRYYETIVSVDSKTNEVRFYGPDKRVRTVELETPEAQAFAKKLKAGDEVVVTFTEALAVSVEPAR